MRGQSRRCACKSNAVNHLGNASHCIVKWIRVGPMRPLPASGSTGFRRSAAERGPAPAVTRRRPARSSAPGTRATWVRSKLASAAQLVGMGGGAATLCEGSEGREMNQRKRTECSPMHWACQALAECTLRAMFAESARWRSCAWALRLRLLAPAGAAPACRARLPALRRRPRAVRGVTLVSLL